MLSKTLLFVDIILVFGRMELNFKHKKVRIKQCYDLILYTKLPHRIQGYPVLFPVF